MLYIQAACCQIANGLVGWMGCIYKMREAALSKGYPRRSTWRDYKFVPQALSQWTDQFCIAVSGTVLNLTTGQSFGILPDLKRADSRHKNTREIICLALLRW